MFAMVDGYKTYIVMAVLLVCVGVEAGLGWDIPGFEVKDDWFAWVMTALGLGALRNGMK